MNGPLFDRPLCWGAGWRLYRRRQGVDRAGEPVAVYDTDHPDYTAAGGSQGAVSWQIRAAEAQVSQRGEHTSATAVGYLYDPTVDLQPFDRIAFGNALWEVRSVVAYPHCRQVEVVGL